MAAHIAVITTGRQTIDSYLSIIGNDGGFNQDDIRLRKYKIIEICHLTAFPDECPYAKATHAGRANNLATCVDGPGRGALVSGQDAEVLLLPVAPEKRVADLIAREIAVANDFALVVKIVAISEVASEGAKVGDNAVAPEEWVRAGVSGGIGIADFLTAIVESGCKSTVTTKRANVDHLVAIPKKRIDSG